MLYTYLNPFIKEKVMNSREICEIINEISKSNLTSAEIKLDNLYIKVEKGYADKHEVENTSNDYTATTEVKEISNVVENQSNDSKNYKEDDEIVLSPLVGTFYNSPSPDKEPYIKVGSNVKKGEVICIVEAMKLMNEIEAPCDGEVTEIVVNNEDMVEYNQALIKIKKK